MATYNPSVSSQVTQTVQSGGTPPSSWNPFVPYVPTLVTIEQILGTQTNSDGGATLADGWPWPLNPDGTDPTDCLKRQLSPPGTVASLGGISGSTFVEIHGVKVEFTPTVPAVVTDDCSTAFCSMNGGGTYPLNPVPTGCETASVFGDTYVNLETFNVPGSCDLIDKSGCL